MTLHCKPIRIDIWHNIVWSRYKGEVFSSLNAINDATEFNIHFFQIAETGNNRVGLANIDLNHHRYPYKLLFKGSIEQIPVPAIVLKVLRHTKESNADFTIIAGFHRPEYWAQLFYLRMAGKKVAVFCDSTIYDKKKGFIRSLLKRIFFSSVHGVFCYGIRSREYVIQYGANPDYVFKRCQAAALPFEYSPENALARRMELAPSPMVPRYLYVGRLSHEKGLDTLLSAFAALIAQLPQATLVLVGSGPEREALERLCRTLKIESSVVFQGSKTGDDLVMEYLQSTCLVLPSTSEPWGLVVNEALSYGCPVIVSEVCGCVPELVIEGKTGFSHKVSDTDDLMQKMAAATTHFADIHATARHCLELISTYSPNDAANQILNGIRRILSAQRQPHER